MVLRMCKVVMVISATANTPIFTVLSFSDDGKYILRAIAVLNDTVINSSSKSVLTQLNELSQYNRIKHDFTYVAEEVGFVVSLLVLYKIVK